MDIAQQDVVASIENVLAHLERTAAKLARWPSEHVLRALDHLEASQYSEAMELLHIAAKPVSQRDPRDIASMPDYPTLTTAELRARFEYVKRRITG
jgi:hypothetical protein